MATQETQSTVTLQELIDDVFFLTEVDGKDIRLTLESVVAQVPGEQLGILIIQAEQYTNTCFVKSRVGYCSRYPDSWEKMLREILESILEVILDLDRVEK